MDLKQEKKLFIISADDDADDQEFIEEALRSIAVSYDFARVPNGARLIALLEDLHGKALAMPDIILLDLNMPVRSGRETLVDIKREQSKFKNIPVVILTTSSAVEDMSFCLNNGACSYLVKPNKFKDLIVILDSTLKRINRSIPSDIHIN